MSLRRTHRLRAGLALLAAAAGALLPAPAVAAPARPDLRLTMTTTVTMTGDTRAQTIVSAAVDNIGTADAPDVTIAFQLPAGAWIIGDPSWQCDYVTFVCADAFTDPQVPAGGSAEPLNIYFGLPVQPIGTVETISATISTSARESTTANNTGQVQTTHSLVPELQLVAARDDSVWRDIEVPAAGGQFLPQFLVTNIGSGPTEDLRLVVQWPAGVTNDGAPTSDTGTNWQCDFSPGLGVCTAGPLAPGGLASITIPMSAPAGTPDTTFTIGSEFTTSTPEWRNEATAIARTCRYV
ncbi:hypothetical protein [Micromonospora sagamiensis]|uniref:Uncharacterized protein n=1 Tax=Micromonospora sagamiensis TaxID=47875 RepID=A0A562WMX7_9ACTN|nr:hypothetical protein [Micromonospora sagamiensis]TWJ31639.1 hypothetical protein JD81_05198 [Micromonospora sagamiensis]BCL15308.1 hypothetical protein GCM10017556_30470 [Micromonospora sagamiensis]